MPGPQLRFVSKTMHYDHERNYTPPEGWLVRDVHFQSEWTAMIVLEEEVKPEVRIHVGTNPCADADLMHSFATSDKPPTRYTQDDLNKAVEEAQTEAAAKMRRNASNLVFALERGWKATATGAYHHLTGETMVASKEVIDRLPMNGHERRFRWSEAKIGTVVRINGEVGSGDLGGFVLEKMSPNGWDTTGIEDSFSTYRVSEAAAAQGFKILWVPAE